MQLQDMQPPGAAPAQGGALPPPNPEITSPLVKSHEQQLVQMRDMMDGKLGDAYDRVLTAGMKMMYAPESAEFVQNLITDDEIPMANKLGEGVANLVVMLDNQGNGTIPKEVLVPVGVSLMFEAADYLFEVGIEVTEDDMGEALELLIKGILIGYGIDPEGMEKVIDDMGEKLGYDPSAEEAAEPAAEEAAEQGVEPASEEEVAFQQGFADQQSAMKG